VAVLGGVAAIWRFDVRPAAEVTEPRSVTFSSVPSGAEVFIGGISRGHTPLTLSIAAGPHDVRVVAGERSRVIHVTVPADADVVHHLDLPEVGAVATPTGTLDIQTEPARLAITVDGVARGTSPLRVESLAPGAHEVLARTDRGVIRRTVRVEPGQATALVLSVAGEPAPAMPGWLTVTSPIPMQLREGGRLLGTTEADRLMLPSGSHEIEVVEPSLGFRSHHKLVVPPGGTTRITVRVPSAVLNVNAQPWAEVWIDGERIGETPLANVSLRIGRHEIVFRHPQLGERRESIVLTAGTPVNLGVDLRRK
jgi:hypothetical protein